jgi:CubicO group peptidase (beta-lactamase class C family)
MQMIFPGKEWPRAEPRECGFDTGALAEMTAVMKKARANGVLIRDGRMVAEWTLCGPADMKIGIQSCTKSITSFALGLAIRDGRIRDVDTLVRDCYPAYEAGPHTGKITFRHVVTMTAGIKQSRDYGFESQVSTEYTEPGVKFQYLNDQPRAIAAALTYVYGCELGEIMNRNLQPLDAEMEWGSLPEWDEPVVTADGRQVPLNCGYARAHFTAADLARVGHLYLNGGRWGDRTVIPEDYVRETLTITEPSAAKYRAEEPPQLRKGYGFAWWAGELGGVTMWGMHGHGRQFCIIVPAYNVVMVKLNDWRDRSAWVDWEVFYPLLLRSLGVPGATGGRKE